MIEARLRGCLHNFESVPEPRLARYDHPNQLEMPWLRVMNSLLRSNTSIAFAAQIVTLC